MDNSRFIRLSNVTTLLILMGGGLLVGCNSIYSSDTKTQVDEKPYYITPVNLTPTDKIGQATDGVDFVSGQSIFKSLEAKSSTSKR